MNKSTRYVFFALLFAVAGFGLYSLMNKQTAITEEATPAATEAAVDANQTVEVAQAEAPKQEEVLGEEAKPAEEIKKDGEVKPEEEATEAEETEETTEEASKL